MEDLDAVDLIAKRALSDPKVRRIVQDAQLFDELRNNAGWQRLFDMVKNEKSKWWVDVQRRLWSKPPDIPDKAEIAYHQGFYEGALFVLSHPDVAERALSSAARTAYALFTDQEDED